MKRLLICIISKESIFPSPFPHTTSENLIKFGSEPKKDLLIFLT